MNSNNNYSDILRLRSHEFYSNVLNSNDLRHLSSQTTTLTTTLTTGTTAPVVQHNHNWLQMSRDFQPILRSNSSLSLDQKRAQNQNNNSFLNSNSIDFKDIQELRECRFGSDRTTAKSVTTTTSSSVKTPSKTVVAKKSRTIGSIQSLSISNENLSKIHPKSNQKTKTKSLFFKTKNNETSSESSKVDLMSEETERRRRLRQLFIHYDIQSALSLDELFVDPKTTTTTTGQTTTDRTAVKSEDDFENEFNSNSLLGFSPNFRNEIGKELVYCLHLCRENSDNNQMTSTNDNRRQQQPTNRCPTHSPSLARQLSCLSSFDMSSDPSQASLLSPNVCPFSKEFDENVLETDFGFNYYRKYFYGFSHQNWFQVLDNTAIALSLRKDSKDLKKFRVILRTNHSLKSFKGFLNLNQLSSDLSLRSLLELLIPRKLISLDSFRLGFDSKSDELLLKFDELLDSHVFKIGILYSRDSQSTEEDFYNNKDIHDPDFDDFLDIIGQRIRLKGYKGFRGGLDVTTDTTGLFARSTTHGDNEIIYHVTNELPFSPNNRQQLLRKRHIGNDIVTVVFQSKRFRGKPFTPHAIRSHFQHIFIVVRPHHDGYRVSVARHKDVPPFGPKVKSFYPKNEFREFLLSKIINGENACHKCAKFKQMALRTRFEYLNDLFKNFSTTTTLQSFLSSNSNNNPLFGTNSSSTQQLIQFSQNFNKYFSQIFPKKTSKKSNSESTQDLSSKTTTDNDTKSIFLENELFFGAKLYESVDDTTTTTTQTTALDVKSRLLCHSFQQNLDLNSVKILLNQNFLIVLNENKKKFVLNLKQVLGFFLQNSSEHKTGVNAPEVDIQLKIYFHQGELLVLKELIRLPVLRLDAESIDAIIEKNSILFELKSDLMTKIKDCDKSMNDSTLRCRQMKSVVLRRNVRTADNSFGFHIQTKKLNSSDNNCVFVTEVNDHALRVNDLRAGQRLLELCSIPVISLSYEQILDFLKTSQTVSVALVQPLSDGSPPINGCFARVCGPTVEHKHDLGKSSENLRQNVVNNNNDYENIQTVVQTTRHPTTTTTASRQSTTPTPKTSPQHNTTYVSPLAHNSRQQTTTGPSPQHMTSHSQRPLHLKPNLHFNQNLSSQSSTTSSTLQEDLIKLLTLNDCEIDETNDRTTVESSNPTDSHSSSRYSTATSTPYSSLERRSDRQMTTTSGVTSVTSGRHTDDCVVTVAKPAFVVNSVNEYGFGRQLREDALNSNVVPTDMLSIGDDEDDPELEWPSIPVLNQEEDTELKEQVKELSKEKLRLNETIRQLKEENQRLHFESQTASQQLRKFTEWFFSSNQNQ